MSKIHQEFFDKDRLEVYNQLIHFQNIGYLAGGTALALQLNHRISVDFDIFVSSAISNQLRLKAERVFGNLKYYVESSDQISFTTEKNINITFVWYYFPLLLPKIPTSSIQLASISDIAADKAHTIGKRAVWRDYVDLFYIIKNDILTLTEIIKLAEKKFKGEFIATQFLEQLVYFNDLTITKIDYIREKYTPAEIKSLLDQQTRLYLKKVLD